MTEETQSQKPKPPQFLIDRAEALAFDHYRNDRLQIASSVLQRLLEYVPQRSDLWTLRGVIERRLENYGDSIAALRKALEIDNENVNAAINLSEVLVTIGQVPTGVELMKGIFEQGVNPDLPPEEQDEYVIRAGAQLEFIKEAIDALRNSEEVRAFLEEQRTDATDAPEA
jgi:tetratricopeptide (TPR) repeat protein